MIFGTGGTLMLQKNILTAANSGITSIKNRPNVILTYNGARPDDQVIKILEREEINVFVSENGAQALYTSCPNGDWHMMIIRDAGLSAPSFDIIDSVRSFSDIPLLTVSDGCDEIYRIMALSKGADACMDAGDEFCGFELKARVISMLRRYTGAWDSDINLAGDGKIFSGGDILTNGSISVDRRKRAVLSDGVVIKTTAIEYGIIEYLMENCGDVCTVNDIYRRVWHSSPYSVRKTVVEHIRRIRSKIEPDPHNPSYIKVVFGVGYKMERAG